MIVESCTFKVRKRFVLSDGKPIFVRIPEAKTHGI